MDVAVGVAAAYAVVFAINLVPALMPASWMVLALFVNRFGLPLLPVTIGGAIVSGLGRAVLAKMARSGRRLLLGTAAADAEALGGLLNRYGSRLAWVTFAYSLGPFPTNHLFIAAGLARVRILWVLVGFWGARIIADTFWVWTADLVMESAGELVSNHGGTLAVIGQLVSLIVMVLLLRLPWRRWVPPADGAPRT